ncbi:MAG: BamA/TamA family outer membrane protein [Elusimicrobiaceae bacterium]|nr:BamA/TamA family outer membrane protein [Elusimicrobiaceae bacterium]
MHLKPHLVTALLLLRLAAPAAAQEVAGPVQNSGMTVENNSDETELLPEPLRFLRQGDRLTREQTSSQYETDTADQCKNSGLDGCTGFRYSIEDYREKIVAPLSKPTVSPLPQEQQNLLDKIFDYIVFTPGSNALILLPIVDSSKDLGPNIGIMPILALRDNQTKSITSVVAPSINYNKYLKTTLAYRQYFFPGHNNLIATRLIWSEVVNRDLFLRYFNPEFLSGDYRFNAELRYWVNGKASFYGIGPGSKEGDKATFALDTLGEEATIGLPLVNKFYLELTHSFYSYKTSRGPLDTSPQLQDKYPDVYAQTSDSKNFLRHKLALFYDSTDHPFIPKLGAYAGVSAAAGFQGVGSDYSYVVYGAQLKQYYNYRQENRYITALNAVFQQQLGNDLPYYAQPVIGERTGIRAYGDGRFVDRGKLVFNLEERFTIASLPVLQFLTDIEVTPFADYGTVFYEPHDVTLDNMKLGYGVALRAVLRPQLVCTAEFAFSKEGTNIIINVDYPF